MKCITACFGSLTKHFGKNKNHLITPPLRNDLKGLIVRDATKDALLCTDQAAEETQIANSAIKGKNEDKLNTSTRKKVTFDLDVKTPDPEECQVQIEALNFLVENNGEGKAEESKYDVIEVGQAINCSSGEKGEKKSQRRKISDEADLVSESSVSSLFSYPPNLRYQNCASSDEDDSVGMDFRESNLADGESDYKNEDIDSKNKDQNGSQDTGALAPEESSESLFSLSIDSGRQIPAVDPAVGKFKESHSVNQSDDKNDEVDSNNRDKSYSQDTALVQEESSESLFSLSIDCRKHIAAVDTDVGEKEVSSPLKPPSKREIMNRGNAREGSDCVQSVLNSIENLSQWNAVRAKTTPPITIQDIENLNLEQESSTFSFWEEPRLKKSPQQRSRRFPNLHKDDEITVDTSLSSWFVVSENNVTNENSPASVGNSSSKRTNTPKSLEGRQILGTLAGKGANKELSPKGFENQSPDEMPATGTIGSYWRRTTESSCEDFGSTAMSKFSEKCSINSTPIQTRLERTLERCCSSLA